MGLRLMLKMPVVTSSSGCSVSMPTRKLRPKAIRLSSRNTRAAKHSPTPTQASASDWKNVWVLSSGQPKACAEDSIEEQCGEGDDEEVGLVSSAEVHGIDTRAAQHDGPGDDHDHHHDKCQGGEGALHRPIVAEIDMSGNLTLQI